jgi:D-sedoheptulose 7-phosphate isomerase
MIRLKEYVESVSSVLQNIQVTDLEGKPLENEKGLSRWCDITAELKRHNNTMFFVGNGASAMLSSHMAADSSKNGEFRCLAFNDAALLTAVSNDIAYEQCFAVPLRRFADKDDVLVTISSSGNSQNILKSIETAREMDLIIITLSGMKPDNRSRKLGDINFFIPGETYGIVETSHLVLLHCWLDKFVCEYKQ